LTVELAEGSTVLDLVYRDHRIVPGKPTRPDDDRLPATYVESADEADTLEIALVDAVSGVEVELSYTIFRDLPAIARSARIRNRGGLPVRVTSAMSAVLDLPDARWTLLQLSGAWARENRIVAGPLRPGRQSVGSDRGSSSHLHNPFMALIEATTTEDHGAVYALSLVYSGNFIAEAEVDPFDTTRVRIGISPNTFSWMLEPGETFATPEAILVFSDAGLGAMSDAFHTLYRERLARGKWRDAPRPILLNNWEATYFAFDEAKLLEIATAAADLSVEMFVLDDGWFGARDDDTTSLGDWFVDRRKLPGGLDGLASKVEALGLRFGLWIEPEMVSERSRLFEAHPDWVVGIPGRPRTESRQQLVLDMSRPEIVDHLFGVLSSVLSSAQISYVKWDMNRTITEPYSPALPADRQGEFFHRYILGVYDLYARLTAAFPEILFESCAGGGGRFDPGLLAFAPQAWTSDDTDAIERLKIQWGTSLVYPLSSMGAHVSAVPNHQTGRITPIETRAAVAFFGVFGYELDPTALTAAERATVLGQIAFYKEHRELFQRGRFIRLRSPFEGDGNDTAWMVVAPDRSRAIVGSYRALNRPAPGAERLRLRGLDPIAMYRVVGWPSPDDPVALANSVVRGGDELMAAGLATVADRHGVSTEGDFRAHLFVLESV
jgi:alpha-galactosidase